jgi:uncharacterized protein (DUF433 family)
MPWQDHIVATPDTLHGAPRFRGTRIPVSVVLDNLAAGISTEELHRQYPTLPADAVRAALAYAADLARDRIVPISA